jgi:nicotinamide-nucleotide amidase
LASRVDLIRASIVASGSELVRGDRHDRNGPFLAGALLRVGIDPARITVVGDDPTDLEAALRDGLSHDLLVVSGGLGPTHDDRTIELLARAAGVGLHLDAELATEIAAISRRVAERLNRPYADFEHGVRKQATIPDGAIVVGLAGTAPAVVLEAPPAVAVALPGPPRELQALWPRVLETAPVRRLLDHAQAPERRVMRFYGASESEVAQALADAGGDGDGVDVTICARDFELHVDLFVQPGAEARAAELEAALESRHLFSREESDTAGVVL